MFLTIFTPAYNRAHLLPRLYESLCQQTCKDFEWLVVDDGSTDGTEELMADLIKKDSGFPVRYYKQENGGKHRAFNNGVRHADGDWFKCLDSDDWLLPDGVERLKPYCDRVWDEQSICSVTALRVDPSGRSLGTECTYDILDSDFFSYRQILRIVGDRSEIVKTAVWREFPFPEFDGERFLAEGGLMSRIAARYKTRYINLKFQYCEYQEGGLTDTFIEKCRANPLGQMYLYSSFFMHPYASFRQKIGWTSSYCKYNNLAKKKGVEIPPVCQMPESMKKYKLLIPAYRFYLRMKKR